MVPTLEVYDSSSGEDMRVGVTRFSSRRAGISTTFQYDVAFLASPQAYSIDPELPLVPGPLHCNGLPGIFKDSSPDRWGRNLLEKEHRESHLSTGNVPRKLDDVDFLIGVFDKTREGSLRFCEPNGNFLAVGTAIPPIVQLPGLMHAASKVVSDTAGKQEIKELLDAGSGSLGGARPKASVVDDGHLLLAKFSHAGDGWDVMAWEKTALDLAASAGIETPAAKLVRVGNESVLLLERFDREGSLLDGMRIPYMSGMTLMQATDGQNHDYAELAEAIAELAVYAKQQLKAFFTRVVFSIAIGNTDDHLRNWGFLRRGGTWTLSPVFDINPNPEISPHRVTSIAGYSGTEEVRGLADLAHYAGLDHNEAAEIVHHVLKATRSWRTIAKRNGCKDKDLKLFQPAFEEHEAALSRAFR